MCRRALEEQVWSKVGPPDCVEAPSVAADDIERGGALVDPRWGPQDCVEAHCVAADSIQRGRGEADHGVPETMLKRVLKSGKGMVEVLKTVMKNDALQQQAEIKRSKDEVDHGAV